MTTTWAPAATITPRDPDIDESAAIEDALFAAVEWDAGRLPLEIALQQGGDLSPHRARGLALRHARHDPRIDAVHRLSEAMSTGNGKVRMPNGGMITGHVKRQSDWLVQQARGNGVVS